MDKKNIILKMFLIMFLIVLLNLINTKINSTYAAWTSNNIYAIDESKYPGYKEKLQKIKSEHPNWNINLYYTGLDWNTVINSEYTGHGTSPKSLIQDTYSGEWICPICKYTRYDVSKAWYCASKQAIGYMMDPRNSLTEDYLFQFQNVASSAGDREAVKQMTKSTFLYKDSCIEAIMEAAQTYGISPFHIVARIKQEQGSSGNPMNGYVYTTPTGEKVVVYNLYNINVSGNDKFQGLENGAKYAYEHGWFTQEASIKGGAEFLKNGYFSQGQTTLYFEKYDVVTNGTVLYDHQYMQNIRAANDEGHATYNNYKTNGILNSQFDFIIPVYENMPRSAVARPLGDNDKYQGNISSQIQEFNVSKNANNEEYINGKIVIVEWINGKSTVPRTLPKLTIESTDGTIKKELYVSQESGNTYYFDKYLKELDKTKRYIIKAELTEGVNISNNKSMTVQLNDKTFSNSSCYIKNNMLLLGNYNGGVTSQLNSIKLIQNSAGDYYISGSIMIIEWINSLSTVPAELPKLTLVSTDGKTSYDMYVNYEKNNDYYFDRCIEGIDKDKKYNIQIELSEINNISKDKKSVAKIGDMSLGTSRGKDIYVKNNEIAFKYDGSIKTELKEIKLNKVSDSKYYISGEINIIETIAGSETVPTKLPMLTIESTDGNTLKQMYISHKSGNTYYFDTYIDELNKNNEYNIYAELTEISNIGANKRTLVKTNNAKLGTIGKVDILLNDNKLKYQYIGNLSTEIKNLTLNKNTNGKYYISGNVNIMEWVNNESTIPTDIPEISLQSTDGKIEYKLYVSQIGNSNTYYFDEFVDNIDLTKKYNLKAKLVTKYNISTNKENIVNISKINNTLGEMEHYKVNIENNNIVFKDNSYKGNLNSELKQFNVSKSRNSEYVSGEIVVVEWINEKSTVPSVKPKMRFKSTDGSIDMDVFVTATGTNTYYFDRFIEGIDTSKEYYFEVESGDSRNVSEYRKVNVYFSGTKFNNQNIGKYHDLNIRLLDNKIKFEKDTYVGNLNTELKQFNVSKSGNSEYVSGEIVVVEWINGKSTVPSVKPKMRFKSTDGSIDMDVFVTPTGTNTYYFDRFIEGIDTSKEYYFEVESGDNRNVSEYRKVNVFFSGTKFNNQIVGKYHDKNIKLLNKEISFC